MSWLGDRVLAGPLPAFWAPGGRWLNRHRRNVRRILIRNRTRPIYVGGEDVLCTVLGRYKMFVDARDISLAPHLMVDGAWEMWVTEAVAALLRPGMIAADVGANLGYFTMIMADICRGGHVHAFEPNPRMAGLLWRNMLINGFERRTTLHADALGDEDGRLAHLVVPEMQQGGAHLVDAAGVGDRASLPLALRRLDGIPGARDAELVKVDAEGSEQAIWRGMAGMIAGTRLHTVLLEFAPVRTPDPAAFLAEIEAAGFSLGYVHESRGMVSATREDLLGSHPHEERMLLLRR